MNYEPIKNVLLVLLGSAGGFFINKGWFTAEQWASLSGAVVTIGAVVWGLYKGRQAGVITTAAALPAVERITVNDVALAADKTTPSNVTASPNAR